MTKVPLDTGSQQNIYIPGPHVFTTFRVSSPVRSFLHRNVCFSPDEDWYDGNQIQGAAIIATMSIREGGLCHLAESLHLSLTLIHEKEADRSYGNEKRDSVLQNAAIGQRWQNLCK